MLTKEERATIAERLKSTEYITSSTLFKALTGEEKLSETSHVKSLCIICSVILGLCDTSNMIELPLDKDGEVIHIGDMVDNVAEGKIYRVRGYEFRSDCCSVLLASDRSHIWTYSRPNVLAHKKPVTIASLAEHLRNILGAIEGVDDSTFIELSNLADNLEILGDSDD